MENACNSTVVIDIEKLQSFLRRHSEDHCISSHTSSSESKTPYTICKVQQLISDRDINKIDYEPIVVSIGPYHQGKENLHHVEKVKWNCLQYILKANPEIALHDYIEALWKLYPVARNYYAEDIKMQSNTFVHMLLLDGCYIIVSICGPQWNIHNSAPLHPVLDEHMKLLEQGLVGHDFLLMENQIPFFIVKRIYELFTSEENTFSLSKSVVVFVEEILRNLPNPIRESETPRNFHHLLHLCHIYFRPTFNGDCCGFQMDCNAPQPNQWHQAVEYHFAGIKFKKREFDINNPHSLLDVCFNNDVLQIPYIFIDEMTVTVIRNLIALEQTNPQLFGNHITTYIDFISQLVRNADDAALLVSREIIGHHFETEDEVSNIFTSLGQCVVSDFSGNYYLKEICQNLEECYESRTKWGKGWLRHANSTIRAWI